MVPIHVWYTIVNRMWIGIIHVQCVVEIERTSVDDGRAVKLRIRSTRESVAGQ
jgi:hypothetical protein